MLIANYHDVLGNRPFRLLWIAQTISNFGDVVYDVVLLWYVLQITNSALATAGIAICTTIGRLFGGITAAAILDRLPVRRIMMVADLVRLVITLGVCTFWLAGLVPSLSFLYLIAFAVSFTTAYFGPARATALPQIVLREHLLQANSLDGISNSVIQIVAWVMGGVLVATVGPAISLLINALSFFLSFLLVFQARWVQTKAAKQTHTNPFAEVLEGLLWIRADRFICIILVAETLHGFVATLFIPAFPLFLKEIGSGSTIYGIQGGIFGAGLLLASYVVGRWSPTFIGKLYVGGMILNGLGCVLVSLVTLPLWVFPSVFLAGLGWSVWITSKQSLLQAYVPSQMYGRTFALFDTSAALMVAPGYVAGGWLADRFSARSVMIVASLIYIMIGVYLYGTQRIRNFHLTEHGPLAQR